MSETEVCVLQVSNISPSATKEQINTLFSYIGRIVEFAVYPSEGSHTEKFAFVKYDRDSCVEVGQHLTNTVFIDRALVCVPAPSNKIPDEETALRTGPSLPGQRQLPPSVTNSVQRNGDEEMLYTNDPTLSSLGLPAYPPLPVDTEPGKVEEIRRTVYIGNLEKGCDGEKLMAFLNACIGEVMYLRMTQENDALACSYAYVEFSKQSSVPLALQNNGIDYNGRALKIQHSRVAIIKPKQKTANQALEEVEEAIRQNEGREAAEIGRGYSPASGRSGSKRRSPSPRRRSSRSPRRSRDRERERSPRRSREGDRDRKSRSPRRRRSRSRDRSDRDRDRRRDRDGDRDRDSERDRDRDRKDRSSEKDERKSSKNSSKDKDRDKERKEKKRSRSKSPKKSKKSKHSSRSPTPKKSKKERKSSPTSLEEEEAELRRRLLEKASLAK
ncbi:unnamed protein product [Bursaphelenchus xylophilus]|uniref:(pine wood nematode) hypothetical protein n=1 Tax=Bursaphelenchus xylophilus TaxID=6326 RepID=A0A1I7S9H7_BURXY|nr:unnamed protein product [Bursaphelenchus xylophilus]CAG9111127.1 unnamed protein product [Bursaphelenchus xylophilus]